MQIKDPNVIIKIKADAAAIDDGLFAVAGQTHLIDIARYVCDNGDTFWCATTGNVPDGEDTICNSGQHIDDTIYRLCFANRKDTWFDSWSECFEFFTDYVNTHNHLI